MEVKRENTQNALNVKEIELKKMIDQKNRSLDSEKHTIEYNTY